MPVADPAPVATWFELFPPSIELAPAPPSGDPVWPIAPAAPIAAAPIAAAPGIVPPPRAAAPAMPAAPVNCTSPTCSSFEVLVGQRILVAFSQEADVVSVFQFFEARGVPTCLLDIAADGPRVLYSAVNHLFFAVPADLKCNGRSKRARGDCQQGHKQHQHEENVALLGAADCRARAVILKAMCHRPGGEGHCVVRTCVIANDRRPTTNDQRRLYPCVKGMLCRLLFNTSSTSTDTGVMCRIL